MSILTKEQKDSVVREALKTKHGKMAILQSFYDLTLEMSFDQILEMANDGVIDRSTRDWLEIGAVLLQQYKERGGYNGIWDLEALRDDAEKIV